MNSIAKMMKRYINMPLKKALPLLFICALVLVATSGCTSSSNTTTSGFGNLAADNLASAINTKYTEQNYTVNTPFTMTKTGDTITYHGVATDGQKVATPYTRNVTVVLVKNRTAAFAAYQTAINVQKAQGFQQFQTSNSSESIFWVGYKGTTFSSDPSVARVRIDLHEPMSIGLILGGENFEYLGSANVIDYYQVLTDQQTLAK
jgi:hypothetical protein